MEMPILTILQDVEIRGKQLVQGTMSHASVPSHIQELMRDPYVVDVLIISRDRNLPPSSPDNKTRFAQMYSKNLD